MRSDPNEPLPPGSTIGILGGGQLGRMLALAAARLGFKCHIFSPDWQSPAFDVASQATIAPFDDRGALMNFARESDVITLEFENIPADTAAFLSARTPFLPSVRALAIAQDRLTEKNFLQDIGVPVAPFAPIDGRSDLETAFSACGLPAVLKTRRFGYDGKGQALVGSFQELEAACTRLGPSDLILEGFIPFTHEISAIVARGRKGDAVVYEIGENRHRNHILHETLVPAPLPSELREEARALGLKIASALDYVGVLGVEMFVLPEGADTRLLVNELAPRVHNSGHWTEDGALTSQFENHIRAVAGWRLGAVALHSPVRMRNLIGADVEAWKEIAADPSARLHLYGKHETRPGRKMGHVNYVEPSEK